MWDISLLFDECRICLVIGPWTPSDQHPPDPCLWLLPEAGQGGSDSVHPLCIWNVDTDGKAEYRHIIPALKGQCEWGFIKNGLHLHLGHLSGAFAHSDLHYFIHTFIHWWRWLPCKVPTNEEQFGVQELANDEISKHQILILDDLDVSNLKQHHNIETVILAGS